MKKQKPKLTSLLYLSIALIIVVVVVLAGLFSLNFLKSYKLREFTAFDNSFSFTYPEFKGWEVSEPQTPEEVIPPNNYTFFLHNPTNILFEVAPQFTVVKKDFTTGDYKHPFLSTGKNPNGVNYYLSPASTSKPESLIFYANNFSVEITVFAVSEKDGFSMKKFFEEIIKSFKAGAPGQEIKFSVKARFVNDLQYELDIIRLSDNRVIQTISVRNAVDLTKQGTIELIDLNNDGFKDLRVVGEYFAKDGTTAKTEKERYLAWHKVWYFDAKSQTFVWQGNLIYYNTTFDEKDTFGHQIKTMRNLDIGSFEGVIESIPKEGGYFVLVVDENSPGYDSESLKNAEPGSILFEWAKQLRIHTDLKDKISRELFERSYKLTNNTGLTEELLNSIKGKQAKIDGAIGYASMVPGRFIVIKSIWLK